MPTRRRNPPKFSSNDLGRLVEAAWESIAAPINRELKRRMAGLGLYEVKVRPIRVSTVTVRPVFRDDSVSFVALMKVRADQEGYYTGVVLKEEYLFVARATIYEDGAVVIDEVGEPTARYATGEDVVVPRSQSPADIVDAILSLAPPGFPESKRSHPWAPSQVRRNRRR